MTRKALIAIMLSVLLLSAAAALADGDFYVGGPWGTRITSLPYTIKAPGSYYLSGNLSYAAGDGITITSDHVTLDLMGFSLTYTGAATHSGIYMADRTNVEIRNGTISGWSLGIYENGAGSCHRIINIRLQNCDQGVYLKGSGHLIKGCEASGNPNTSGLGIQWNGTISGCLAQNFSLGGIYISGGCGIISGNVVIGNGATGSSGIICNNTQTLIMDNQVSNCNYGISFYTGSTVIGNTVSTVTGQTGINGGGDPETLVDQNTVLGTGTHTNFLDGAQTRNNAY